MTLALVDTARLGMLTGGDEDLHRELVELFVHEGRRYLDELVALAAAGDHVGVARSAHRLRGAASNLGAPRLGEAAQIVEDVARAGVASSEVVAAARDLFELTCAALRPG